MVLFLNLGGLTRGRVQGCAVAGPGEGDVGSFPIQARWADDERCVACDALALVDGHRIAVVEMARGEVAGVEAHGRSGPEEHIDGGRVGIHCSDGADHAVVDPHRMAIARALVSVVAADEHAVASLEGSRRDCQHWS